MKSVLVNWFEVPVSDLDRAIAFYKQIFACEMEATEIGNMKMAFFPAEDMSGGATGALMLNESYVPSHEGTLVYFSTPDVAEPLSKVAKAGGKVMLEKTQISPEHGYMCVFEDTEGNRVALHSNK